MLGRIPFFRHFLVVESHNFLVNCILFRVNHGKSPFFPRKIPIFHGKILIFHGKITIFHGKITIFHGKHGKITIFHGKITMATPPKTIKNEARRSSVLTLALLATLLVAIERCFAAGAMGMLGRGTLW
jgi:hypothetical protein